MNNLKKIRFATIVVIISIICIILYTIVDLFLFYQTGNEPEITPYIFGFFGTELTVLAIKRILDNKKKKADKDDKTNKEEEDDNL
jgi:hypothetical protein